MNNFQLREVAVSIFIKLTVFLTNQLKVIQPEALWYLISSKYIKIKVNFNKLMKVLMMNK